MPTLQVLVTTMHDEDLFRYRKMNLRSDALFANQADGYRYLREEIGGHCVEQLTTATRGLSRNRNLALSCSDPTADYVMFSDDDLTFYDGYEELIFREFEKHPSADAIRFNIKDVSKSDGVRLKIKQIEKFRKATKWNSGGYGVIALVVRRSRLLLSNIRFNECFGAGSENPAGEDSIFVKQLLKRGFRMYYSPVTIGELCTVGSTWFSGHDEKYFVLNGKITYINYPFFSYFLPFVQAFRFKRRTATKLSYFQIVRAYFKGIKEYKSNK